VLFYSVYQFSNAGLIDEETQLNAVYFPLLTFPWLPLVKKSLWRYFGMTLVTLAVFYSLKRTALVALAMAAVTYVIVDYVVVTRRLRLVKVIVPAVLLCLAVVTYYRIDELRGGTFSSRLRSTSTDEGSGRLGIYAAILDELKRSSVNSVVLGHGHYSSVGYVGKTAHNDFLEVVFDYGMVGLSLYVLLHFCLITKSYKLLRSRSPFASAYAASYVVFFGMSMVSHLIIYPTYFVFMTALWGTIEGTTQGQRRLETDALRRAITSRNHGRQGMVAL
jgi:O-antigen ligase